MSDTQKNLDRLVARLRIQEANPGGATAASNGLSRPAAASITDEAIIEKCRAAKNAAKFSDLYDHGDVHAHHGGDESVADLALLGIMAYYTQDEEQLERLISTSALGQRAKWRNRAEYRRRTIRRALSGLGEVYDWARNERGRLLASSSSSPLFTSGDDDNNQTYAEDAPKVVWFSELGEPKERKYIIEKVGVKGYPIVAFGAGGVAKSFVMLSAGIAIASASGVDEWLGLRILEHGHVLYLDFELDVDEQHRRVRDLCNGLGALVPKRLAYLSGVGLPAETAFDAALSFVRDHKAKAVIIDSMGLALEGDAERGKDVLAFHRRYVDPLRRVGATPFIVDHEGKLQAGEKHRHKSPIGSAYKAWAARSVLQFELEEYDKENSALDIRVRQTKTNFTPIEPFGVRFTFEEKKVSIKSFELDDAELVEEESVPVRERILGALRVEPATNSDLQKLTGASVGTIRNNLSALMQEGEVEEDGYKGRSKVYKLSSSSDVYRKAGDDDNNQASGQRIGRLLNDPPGWLARQLEQFRRVPDRYMKPTAAAIASEVYGDALRWEEVAPSLEACLEDSAKNGST
jgi:hypothetical protein